ncbi:tRNA epoxyqueuosine(34) reductase QueG [sulfur-oxidizing endosymbiont of Gigantopelta aegis]|uniref:tRNA epoxyqueuosine(34) reductase QueG n=1 Tax=sulfur-oxidizing endosymbiont of Gigantopelta aegis TaxID=2794934 RepID=UPI0018DBFEDC|nr:tRNA epoxyqueuosine(34) reductase QueG [sulfur-oxidizing endosymbiont of Gigantopelta aegis]
MTQKNNTHKQVSQEELCAPENLIALVKKIKQWGLELGFQAIGITDTDLTIAEQRFNVWLEQQMHGSMEYMSRHGTKRTRPAELEQGTLSIISVRMDYFPEDPELAIGLLEKAEQGYIARYSLGRDYHKVVRKRLQTLAKKLEQEIGAFGYRVFTDSAPVLEKPLAEKAGIGWIGKHSNVLQEKTGSWFFLGEIFTNLPLPIDTPAVNHCGNCTKCIDVCPTQAIVEPYVVDSRRCISYLTIESHQAIPVELRPLMGNRIYGCDDCQLFCPWNRFSQQTVESDYFARGDLASPQLIDLFLWSESEFLKQTEGTAIRRIGHESWLRNIAVALGNCLAKPNTTETAQKTAIIDALNKQLGHPSELVKEHVIWALAQQQ